MIWLKLILSCILVYIVVKAVHTAPTEHAKYVVCGLFIYLSMIADKLNDIYKMVSR